VSAAKAAQATTTRNGDWRWADIPTLLRKVLAYQRNFPHLVASGVLTFHGGASHGHNLRRLDVHPSVDLSARIAQRASDDAASPQ
jgi:hypothetical protein